MRSGLQGQELKDDNLFGFVLPFLILVSKFEMLFYRLLFLVSSFCIFVIYFLFLFQYLNACSKCIRKAY